MEAGDRAAAGAWLLREPRALPHVRAMRTSLRTLHLAAMAILYGGHVFGVDAPRLIPAVAGTITSGAALAALDAWRAPIWLVQIRGAATYLKLLLVASVAIWWEGRVVLLTLALVVGAVSSHMPGRWRYHSLLHGRPVGPRDLG
jgi:hypothetical protein